MQHLFEQLRILEYAIISGIFGLVNMLVRPIRGSKWLYLVEFIISVCVATFMGVLCTKAGLDDTKAYLLVAVSALIARDILGVITGFGDFIGKHQETVFEEIFNIIKAKLRISTKKPTKHSKKSTKK